MNVLILALDAVVPAEVPDAHVLVVAPALNSWLRHWLSDEDAARRRAEERVAACLERLERSGVQAEGRVGDADPLQAIADALPTFPADEIVIAAQPEHSPRLADELVSRARDRFALPIFRTPAQNLETHPRPDPSKGDPMKRFRPTILSLLAALTTLALVGALQAAPKAGTLTGTVGPGFTITLTQNGKKVTTLKAGTYKIVINDKASIHDFHLTGPGVNKTTTVSGTGTTTWTVTLKKGKYHYQCDPHQTVMFGNFTVT